MSHDNTGEKRCQRCQEVFPATADVFGFASDGKTLSRICRGCRSTAMLERSERRRQRIKGQEEGGTIACLRCGEAKPADAKHFPVRKDSASGLKRTCRPCYAEEQREKYAANKAHKRGLAKQWPSSRLEKRREYVAARKARDPMGFKLTMKACSARYRVRKSSAEGNYTRQDVERLFAQQAGRCWWCGVTLGSNFHVDHRVPLAQGGTNFPDNLVCACGTCNVRKWAKMPSDWIGRLL